MLGEAVPMKKYNQPNKIQGFFHGIDPATKGDYYTDVVHLLTEKPRTTAIEQAKDYKWIPFLVDIVRLKKREPNDIMDIQVRLFNKYPPMRATIDSTREDFLSSALIRKYGETRIIPMKFANSGNSNTKFKLKQLGFAYIDAGYEWPDPILLEKKFPRFAKLLRILKKEMMMEQVKYTENNRVTFQHPVGKHNDLVHGWEMSLNSVMEFQKRNLGFEKRATSDANTYKTVAEDIYKNYSMPSEDEEEDDSAIYDRVGISRLPFR